MITLELLLELLKKKKELPTKSQDGYSRLDNMPLVQEIFNDSKSYSPYDHMWSKNPRLMQAHGEGWKNDAKAEWNRTEGRPSPIENGKELRELIEEYSRARSEALRQNSKRPL